MEKNHLKSNKETWKDEEIRRGKERLKTLDKRENIECCLCKNQTFILNQNSDFPYFDAICSKCGCISLRR
jgi:hypothetical protein